MDTKGSLQVVFWIPSLRQEMGTVLSVEKKASSR